MTENHERTLKDIEDMKRDFQELKKEVSPHLAEDPEMKEEAEYMLASLEVLLEELNHVKTEKDLTLKRNIRIDAFLAWIGQFLPSMMGEEDEEDEEFDEDDLDGEDFDLSSEEDDR